ncbi:bis(5'-nucleosyl)-tetraphosphatase, symmetrical [Candidatus Photodesmus blepharus]|uniref:Bis(5'-nucleosyl)-tetraphosphatase, symmetrical n=1 Tax=Candidatus Photodesmus blepharonis TaxID=1179155 RepID=A0A084CM17_9GAMM|nr:symmetrical bis(5'-nucleosyl)-tetraphosphatase [Candidatus Photodesmus blepharus]KEY90846.1 bis(5'-nucleosyl)-tetraphosphatase, symmetrical [Candidatus Photodesmus blepharus]
MSNYIVGDVQGCFDELRLLLSCASFDPSKDTLWLTGDLIARGPKSLETLRFIKNLGNAARVVLGNHELHLLAVSIGVKKIEKKDKTSKILFSEDKQELLNWLRFQPLMAEHEEFIVCHAGISPQWTLSKARAAAREVEQQLQKQKSWPWLIKNMYTHTTQKVWSNTLSGIKHYCYTINAFTRMRFCYSNGELDMKHKHPPSEVRNKRLIPWFKIPWRQPLDKTILFGHWAGLDGYQDSNVIALDTGCVWGKTLTMLCWESKTFFAQNALNKQSKLINIKS